MPLVVLPGQAFRRGPVGVRVVSFLVATLVISFAAVSRRHDDLASAVWSVGFDTAAALGSVAVGVSTHPLAVRRAGEVDVKASAPADGG